MNPKKPVNQYNKNGEFIRQWESASEAGRKLGIHSNQIGSCCTLRLDSAGGFVWRYADFEGEVGQWVGNRKPVLQYEKDGSFVKEWASATEAASAFNTSVSRITECCKGIYKTSHGYVWKYKFNGENHEKGS